MLLSAKNPTYTEGGTIRSGKQNRKKGPGTKSELSWVEPCSVNEASEEHVASAGIWTPRILKLLNIFILFEVLRKQQIN